jgi:benzoyl-CoA reductase/2-hydroxyglutaryl-CoA dehydratase subunit BcrC/BadD/HgdB
MDKPKKNFKKSLYRGIYQIIASELEAQKGRKVSPDAVRKAIERGNAELQGRFAEIVESRLEKQNRFRKLTTAEAA